MALSLATLSALQPTFRAGVKLVRKYMIARDSVYTIDPRGLAAVVDAGQFMDQTEWPTYLQKTTNSLR